MKNLYQQVLKLKNNRKLVYFAVILSFFILILSLALTYRIRSYNSDDVGIQNALLSWKPFSGQILYLSPDTWIINIPFYEVFQHLFSPSRRLLFAEGALFSIINLSLFYIAIKYFYKKLKIGFNLFTILPILWLASFNYYFTILFLNTNLRNFEIGLTFILFMLVSKILLNEFNPIKSIRSIVLSVLFCLLVGVLILNDPMYFYYGVLPVIALSLILYLKAPSVRKQIRNIISGLVLSGVFYEIVKYVVVKSGIKISPQPISFVGFSNIFSNLNTALHGLILLFGADIFNRSVINLITIGYLLNFVLLVLVVYFIFSYFKPKTVLKNEKSDIAIIIKYFFSWLAVYVFLVYFLSNQLVNVLTYRYLVLIPFIAIIFIASEFTLFDKNIKKLFGVIIILATIFNIGTSIAYQKDPTIIKYNLSYNYKNSQNFSIINFLESKHLYKGYGQYWDANINSYLSDNKIDIYPIQCINNKTTTFNWFVNGGQLNRPNKNSFLMLDYSGTPMCSLNDIIRQFGKPKKIYNISGLPILIYNYDIGIKINE